MNNKLLKKIVLGLLVILLGVEIILWLNHRFDFDNVLSNICSELIGIIVTLYFVERLLENNKKNRWKSVEKQAKWEIEMFIFLSLLDILRIIGLKEKIEMKINTKGEEKSGYYHELEIVKIDDALLRTDFHNQENVYISTLKKQLPNSENFQSLSYSLEHGKKIVDIFKDNLEPEDFHLLYTSIQALETLKNISPTYSKEVQKKLSDTQETEITRNAFLSSVIFSNAVSFSSAIRSLYSLYNSINSSK